MTYYIYRHIAPDGKSYIGKTKDPNKRYQKGKGYRQCPKFWKAIQEFGWENIKHEILAITDDDCEARRLEKKMIKKYDTINNGYDSNNDIVGRKYIPKGYYKIYGQYDLKGNLIKKYVGNNELRRNNYSPERVNWCARGKTKTAHGYKWKIEGKCEKVSCVTKCY